MTPAASIHTLTKVIDADAPDPWVLVDATTYYAFTTFSGNEHIPGWSSSDMMTWKTLGDTVPTLPSWSSNDVTTTWAPSVTKFAAGDYRMVYATHHATYNVQCLALARASNPQGPYTNVGTTPLACGPSNTGALDGSFFRNGDGNLYLTYRIDGLPVSQPQLYVQTFSNDGLSLVGSPTGILSSSLAWEGNLLVGPDLISTKTGLMLFYGGNQGSSTPAIGIATASTLLGPYTKQTTPAIAPTSAMLITPAGPSTFVGLDSNNYIVFHTYNSAAHTYRPMFIAPLAQLVANGNIPAAF